MQVLGKLLSGEVVVDRRNSHLRENAARYLPDALAQIHSRGRTFIAEEVDFGQPIGKTICVRTNGSDEIVWAWRKNRPADWTRFVKNREPEKCSSLMVILMANREAETPGQMVLISAFIGRRAEPEPWDRNASERSFAFWESHALVWGYEETIRGTETKVCPWTVNVEI